MRCRCRTGYVRSVRSTGGRESAIDVSGGWWGPRGARRSGSRDGDVQLDRALESVSHRVVELAEIVIATMTGSTGATWSDTSACRRCSRGRRRSPGDLRIVAALLHIIGCVVRMGRPVREHRQASAVARLRGAEGQGHSRHDLMGQLRARSRRRPKRRSPRATSRARDLVRVDGEINRLNRAMCNRAVDVGNAHAVRAWPM